MNADHDIEWEAHRQADRDRLGRAAAELTTVEPVIVDDPEPATVHRCLTQVLPDLDCILCNREL